MTTHNKGQNNASVDQGNKGENGRALQWEPLDNGQGKSAPPSDIDREDGYDTTKDSTVSNGH